MAQKLLAVILLSMAAIVAGQKAEDTTGKTLSGAQGYRFGSDVGGYLKVSLDVCDIKAALNNKDWNAAKKIYTDGKNSFKSNGSPRTLRGMATDSYAGEPFFDNYTTYFGSAAFLDKFVMDALNGNPPYIQDIQRQEVAGKSIESTLQMVYLMHELDEAADKIRNNDLSIAKGAPHNIDESWALYVGQAMDCGLYNAAFKRSVDFGTMESCQAGNTNSMALAAHQKMYAAAKAGDLAAFEAARKEMERSFVITYLQATLKYANELDKITTANKDPTEYQAEGFAFFRTIEPLVAAANKTAAADVHKILTPGSPVSRGATEAAVLRLLTPTYAKLGISDADVGKYGNIQALNATCAKTSGAEGLKPLGGLGSSSSWLVMALAAVAALLALL